MDGETRPPGTRRGAFLERAMTADSGERFEEHVLPHLDSVFRMARRLARNDSVADDLVQETFIRAFRAFPRFEMRDFGVRPWLFKILHHAFYTHRGKSRRQPSLLDDVNFDLFEGAVGPTVPAEGGIENIAWEGIDEELKHAVESLKPQYRVVLLLWSFEELSYKEIAEVCDCAIGTVMSRLYRARRLLAEKLSGYAERENIRRKP